MAPDMSRKAAAAVMPQEIVEAVVATGLVEIRTLIDEGVDVDPTSPDHTWIAEDLSRE